MEPFWGVVIGSAIGALIIELIQWFKPQAVNPDSKGYGVASIVIGILFLIPFISLIGLVLGLISLRKTKWKLLSWIGIILNSLLTIFWGIMLIAKYI
ncbi:hypothetical protein KAU33_05075 [Candidatus Dependentiae bacterium]|nr:hypothetical protein [Candidatus Dependentiae bacterium]